MAFASVQKNGGVAITPRTVMRVERPLSVNSGHNTSAGSGGGSNNKPVAGAGAGAGAAVSAPVRPKSASPSSSTAYHRRSSSGSVGKNGFDTTAGVITKNLSPKLFKLCLSLSVSVSVYVFLCFPFVFVSRTHRLHNAISHGKRLQLPLAFCVVL
jgi:hypothetical protein